MRRLPRTSSRSSRGCARRRQRECYDHGWFCCFSSSLAVFPSFVARPEFLVVLRVRYVILMVLASPILRSILDLGRFLRASVIWKSLRCLSGSHCGVCVACGVLGAFFGEMTTLICYVSSACGSTVDLCSHVLLRSSRYSHIFYVKEDTRATCTRYSHWERGTLYLGPVSGSHLFGICCLSSTGMRIIRTIPGDDFRTVSELSALLGSSMDTRSCVNSRSFGGFYT